VILLNIPGFADPAENDIEADAKHDDDKRHRDDGVLQDFDTVPGKQEDDGENADQGGPGMQVAEHGDTDDGTDDSGA